MAAEWISNAGLVLARAVHFAACLFLAGFWIFDRILPKELEEGPLWRSALRKANLVLFPLLAVSGIVWFLFVAEGMGGDLSQETLRTVWEQTAFGTVQCLRAWLLLLVAVPLAIAVLETEKRSATSWGALAGCALLLGSLAWAGHGATGPHPLRHRMADVLHLLAAGAWPAGLLPLALLLRAGVAERRVLRRFSAMSLSAVAALTATGLVNAACLVGSWHGLFGTSYGRTLLVKSCLFVTMVGLGAANLLWLSPRIGETAARNRLGLHVRVELCLAFGIVGAVALLGILPPAFFQSYLPSR